MAWQIYLEQGFPSVFVGVFVGSTARMESALAKVFADRLHGVAIEYGRRTKRQLMGLVAVDNFQKAII